MSLKEFVINTLDIAQWNFTRSLLRLKPEHLEYQITPNTNPIRWLIGHLMLQMDSKFNYLCQGERKLSKELREYFATGAADMSDRKEFPISYKELIETYLEISTSMFEYLRKLPEKKFEELPEHNVEGNTENIYEIIQRVALHFLGHTGQIQLIKKELGKGGYFVTGIKKKQREDSRIKWLNWWNENKENFS
jgi:hypothetical protein